MLDFCGYKDKIPDESDIAGVPKSEKPNQKRVVSGPNALPIDFLFNTNPKKIIWSEAQPNGKYLRITLHCN